MAFSIISFGWQFKKSHILAMTVLDTGSFFPSFASVADDIISFKSVLFIPRFSNNNHNFV